ncbi:hypothetical protein WJS89_02790 [Sphingomicrobium sp. XHP0235]|uniref:hypothetical protein n=1 Tax=Sphingomicrobium aquimarinum TaxID=3133971 RepID=UPI0031FF30CA
MHVYMPVRVLDEAAEAILKRDDTVKVVVEVPKEDFERAWNELGRYLDPEFADMQGWDNEDDVKVAVAAFVAASDHLPAFTSDLAKWLLRNDDNGDVRLTFEEHRAAES